MRFLLIALFVSMTNAQINVQVQIVAPNATFDQGNLNTNLEAGGLPPGTIVSTNTQNVVLISQCTPGTYTESGSTVCHACPAGTASTAPGAVSSDSCQTCSPGSFAPNSASTCSLCPASTYSMEAGAASQATCTRCPQLTNSAPGADAVTSCACQDSYFTPLNVLAPIDPRAAAQFSSWQALAGPIILDIAHLACS